MKILIVKNITREGPGLLEGILQIHKLSYDIIDLSRGEYFEVELTEEGRFDPLFAGLESSLKIFHLHGETVHLSDKMRLLATGKYCQNQIVKIADTAYGIQGHFELTPNMFAEWRAQDPWLIPLDQKRLQSDYEQIRIEYETVGKQLLTNFLKITKIIQ